ncbi:DUF6327 family protein [Xanthomarina sp. F1114]|uniref:DUF6327 family protein n=1 Tax=Xanthomarina sp. F1114 TaxID=2996019 RepID=UPI00225E6E1A|nr:DUF6327 family protein [Xanthomarina sp. F1114]MCX7547211.1 DUF6327 family protein [Xanthomarina sp. F1114]
MKQYQSFEDIERELKHLDLERKIAWEEMKLLKSEFQDDLKPANWVQLALKIAGKYGLFLISKRFFK